MNTYILFIVVAFIVNKYLIFLCIQKIEILFHYGYILPYNILEANLTLTNMNTGNSRVATVSPREAPTPTVVPVATYKIGDDPRLQVLDIERSELEPVHTMFEELQGFKADKESCYLSMPDPSRASTSSSALCCLSPPKIEKGKFINTSCDFRAQQKKERAIPLLHYTCSLLERHFKLHSFEIDRTKVTVNKETPLVEAHRYACHKDCDVPRCPFAWHQDDKGGVDYNTYTVIYYLQKSEHIDGNGFKGGDFSCAFPKDVTYDTRDSDVVTKTEDTIREDGETLEVYHITTKTGRVVLLRGDVWHTPGLVQNSSHGCRDSLVIQIKRHD